MREIICLNTKKKFKKFSVAARYAKVKSYIGIKKCCNKMQQYSGEINGNRAYWMYLDEYMNLSYTEKEYLDKKIKSLIGKKIVCLNNNKVFDSLQIAADWINKHNPKMCISTMQIKKCCEKKSSSAGKINMIKARWMYLDEYKPLLLKSLKENNIAVEKSNIKKFL